MMAKASVDYWEDVLEAEAGVVTDWQYTGRDDLPLRVWVDGVAREVRWADGLEFACAAPQSPRVWSGGETFRVYSCIEDGEWTEVGSWRTFGDAFRAGSELVLSGHPFYIQAQDA